jgi:hypothetical protein
VVQIADLHLAQHHPADAYKRVTDFLKTNPSSPELLLLGWRAARELKDPVAAQMAWRMQSDFPDSDQAPTLAQMSGSRISPWSRPYAPGRNRWRSLGERTRTLGLSLDQVADHLKLDRHGRCAREGDHRAISAAVFVRGFLRRYAALSASRRLKSKPCTRGGRTRRPTRLVQDGHAPHRAARSALVWGCCPP